MAVQPSELMVPKAVNASEKHTPSATSALRTNDREKLLDNQKWACMKNLVASFAGIVLIVVQQQMAIWDGGPNPWPNDPDFKETLNYVRWVISMLTLLSVYYLFDFYKIECTIMVAKNLLPPDSSLFSSTLFPQFFLEALFLAVHPFPHVDSLGLKSPHLYLALTLFPFARVVYVARGVHFWSALNSANGRFIGALTSVDFTSSFMLKTALRNHPGRCIFFCLSALLFFAGYALYVTERIVCSYEREDDPSACGGNADLLGFWDAEWILIITILTVGYGDLYPYTHGGRFVAVTGGLMGTLMTAVTIALTTDYLNLSRSESKVVSFLKRNSNKKLVYMQAARSVQTAYRHYLARKKPDYAKQIHPRHKGLTELTHHLFSVLSEFRAAKRYAVANDGSDPVDKQITMLETLEVNLDELKEKVEHLSEHHESTFTSGSKDYPLDSQAQHGLNGLDGSVPRWAAPLGVTFARIIQEIAGLGDDISRVKLVVNEQVAENTRRTDARIEELEKKIQMLLDAQAQK